MSSEAAWSSVAAAVGDRAQVLARLLGVGRTVFGLALLASPRLARPWIGDAARMPGGEIVIRAFGARDAALGIGTLLATGNNEQLRRWLVAASACDAVDFAATLFGPPAPARPFILVLASGAAVGGLGAAAVI